MPNYGLQPLVPGGLQLASTWEQRFFLLIQSLLAFFVAIVVLPAAVFAGVRLGMSLTAGQEYTGRALIASAVLVISTSVVGIAIRYAVTRLVRAIRPLEPIYPEVATGAAIPTMDRTNG
jgi:hypothetical protein